MSINNGIRGPAPAPPQQVSNVQAISVIIGMVLAFAVLVGIAYLGLDLIGGVDLELREAVGVASFVTFLSWLRNAAQAIAQKA